MGGWYTYKVRWYDDVDKVTNINQGITCASSCADAMIQLERRYGENTIIEVTLYKLEASDCLDCLELSPEAIAHLRSFTVTNKGKQYKF